MHVEVTVSSICNERSTVSFEWEHLFDGVFHQQLLHRRDMEYVLELATENIWLLTYMTSPVVILKEHPVIGNPEQFAFGMLPLIFFLPQ